MTRHLLLLPLLLTLTACDPAPTMAHASHDLATTCDNQTTAHWPYSNRDADPCVAYWLRKIYERMATNGAK